MRIAFFSTGIPDPSQGGSGIFNYLICQYLLRHGYGVSAWFRASQEFIQSHCQQKYLQELAAQGLSYQLVSEVPRSKIPAFGLSLLLREHQYRVCQNITQQISPQFYSYGGAISLDLGWALALAEAKPPFPAVCILGDPLPHRLKWGAQPSFLTVQRWIRFAQLQSLRGIYRVLRKRLSYFDGQRAVVGSFAAHHAKEFSRECIKCRHFQWFTPDPVNKKHTYQYLNTKKLVILHVGSLYSTPSQKMLKYWSRDVLPSLKNLSHDVEVRFVGRADTSQVYNFRWQNVQITFTGHLDSLEEEFAKADIFLYVVRYPVGTRTRIVTALSYGIPVIADKTVALGLPELKDGRDILYSSSPQQLSRLMIEVSKSPHLMKHLGRNARLAWERYYNPEINIPDMLQHLYV